MFGQYLRALKMGANQWPRMILAFVGMMIDALTVLAVPVILRRAVDVLGGPFDEAVAVLERLALDSLVLALIRAGGIYLEIYMQESTGNRIGARIRKMLHHKILRLPFSFFDKSPTGDIMSRLTKDVDAVRDGTGFVVLILVVNIVMFTGTLIAMLLMDATLTLGVLVLVPFILMVAVLYTRFVRPVYDEVEVRSGRLHTVAQENISGIRVVKAFVRASEEKAKFDRENEALLRANLRINRLNSLVNPCMDYFGVLLTLVVLGLGGYRAALGSISLGTVLAFLSYVQFVYWPLRQTGWLAELFSRAMAGADRIFYLLGREEQSLGGPADAGREIRGHLVFEHVSFSYDDEAYSLHDFNLSIAPGENVAIVGGTGSGKTTVVNLIARFYDPSSGRVLLDGRDLRSWCLEDLRCAIGFVFQDNFLFSFPIRDNIALGRPGAELDDIRAAAGSAQIAETVEGLSEGYDTVVGERGVGLSGGERQRVALARALLLDPAILVLDDSTASLDARTENAVQKALASRAVGKTVITVAQRIATAMRADRIIVMDGGRIVEEGTHEELLAQGKIYAALYREQMSLLAQQGKEAGEYGAP